MDFITLQNNFPEEPVLTCFFQRKYSDTVFIVADLGTGTKYFEQMATR
ncbi:MAG: hypothetical protein JKY62_10035 [Desulfocapsa sp.]|nr:hypothetical protein [Desulfocapsa sp.]